MKKWYVVLLAICFILSSWTIISASGKETGKKPTENEDPFELGVDVLLNEKIDKIKGKNVGLITNPTGVDQNLNSIVDVLFHHEDVNLVALYGPEHGVRGGAQAGEGVDFYIDEKTGLPVYSLYGDTKKPTPEMLEGVDVLLFDIQDVGARFYTYIYTMAYAMEAAAENDIEIIVLDRPNPISGLNVQGPVLDPDYSSFVGLYPIPQRHGMTVGELALLFNEEFDINAELTVVNMHGWERSMYYDDTPLAWVLPSPNMPTLDTAIVYPGAALIEGTNVSEGRGTTKPFELIGAPFIDADALAEQLNAADLPGVRFRAAYFTPQFSKHAGELSGGIEIYVTDRAAYQSIKTGLTIVKTIHDMYQDDFAFRAENNDGISFFDNLIGNGWVREKIEQGASVDEITNEWQADLQAFKEVRRDYLLYTVTAADIKSIIASLEESGEIMDDDAVHKLELHVTAVSQYEQKNEADKVIKHMKSFKALLDYQKENELISDKAHKMLQTKADAMIQIWQ
ncbi:DUF1343 domain-containing protein [Virgibacillus dakarensis]|nr:DUF1343 domain-containing protein [Virgibacillus dakarensis]